MKGRAGQEVCDSEVVVMEVEGGLGGIRGMLGWRVGVGQAGNCDGGFR